MRLAFAGHVVDCDRFELRRGDQRIDVQPKVFAFLRLLAEQAHRTIPKDETRDALWPGAP
jgi:DNA-binding winged helix-turn-helix (wHTH) protein